MALRACTKPRPCLLLLNRRPSGAPEPAPVDPDPNFPVVWEMDSLFGETPRQLTLAEAAPRKPRPAKPTVTHRSPVPLANLDDWLDFAEALLGRQDIKEGTLGRTWDNLTELSAYEEEVEDAFHMDMDSFMRVAERFPWLKTAEEIAADQGFFHWELRFASVFAEGGFDLQVGNPPWVQPQWDENAVLAECDPWFELVENNPVAERANRIKQLISSRPVRGFVLDERAVQAGISEFIGSVSVYRLLVGTKPDFYRAFMIRCWGNTGLYGAVGLLHPDTHFTGDAERLLRAEAYRRLRIHGDYVNSGNRFFAPPVSRTAQFGIHIYGRPGDIRFAHLSWLLDAGELPQSLEFAEVGEIPQGWGSEDGLPGVKYKGDWDRRPHPDRVIFVDHGMLALWGLVSGGEGQSVEHTKLLHLVTIHEQGVVSALGRFQPRLADFKPQVFLGYDEGQAKKIGLIKWQIHDPSDWSHVIFKGPQIGVATPFFKQPPETGTKGRPQDLRKLQVDALPRSEYTRAADAETYRRAQEQWVDHRTQNRRPYTEIYRVMWRSMIAHNTDRSLFSSIIPPGPAHVDVAHSLGMPTNRGTALVAGLFAALPIDYWLRVTGRTHFRAPDVNALPGLRENHCLVPPLLLRALRLNCLTTAYADLWSELFEDAWRDEGWTVNWPNIAPLSNVGPTWERATPLRTEYERRAALVEIDALLPSGWASRRSS